MIDPLALILAPPALAFGWVAYDLRRHSGAAQEEPVAAPVPFQRATAPAHVVAMAPRKAA